MMNDSIQYNNLMRFICGLSPSHQEKRKLDKLTKKVLLQRLKKNQNLVYKYIRFDADDGCHFALEGYEYDNEIKRLKKVILR